MADKVFLYVFSVKLVNLFLNLSLATYRNHTRLEQRNKVRLNNKSSGKWNWISWFECRTVQGDKTESYFCLKAVCQCNFFRIFNLSVSISQNCLKKQQPPASVCLNSCTGSPVDWQLSPGQWKVGINLPILFWDKKLLKLQRQGTKPSSSWVWVQFLTAALSANVGKNSYFASSSSSVLCMASVSYLVLHWATSAFAFDKARCSSAFASCSSSYCSLKRSLSWRDPWTTWAKALFAYNKEMWLFCNSQLVRPANISQ